MIENEKTKEILKILALSFILAIPIGCPKGGKSVETGKHFNADFYYTQKITNFSCFIIEFIEILPSNEVQPILAGYFTAKIGETSDTKAKDVKVFNKSNGIWESKGDVEIKILPEKLSVSVILPYLPYLRKTYLEIKVLTPQADELCKERFEDLLIKREYKGLVAIGRTPIFDPEQMNQTIGILSPVAESDIFPGVLSSTRAYPMAVQLDQNIKTGFRKFLLCGGMDILTHRVLRTCDIVDEENLSIVTGPVMNFPRIFGAISLISDGRVAISGGLDSLMKPVPFLEVYDPYFDIFLRITKVLPRFKNYMFSTDQNVVVVGGVGEGGVWDRRVEIFPHAITQSKPAEIKRFLYTVENPGDFGACFAEDDLRAYIIGGIGSAPQITRIYKKGLDAGIVSAETVKIEGIQSFGNCKALKLGAKLLVAGSYGQIYFITWDKESVSVSKEDLPKEVGQLKKSKKGFSFIKLSEGKAVMFGGFDYITFQEGQTSAVVPSSEILILSQDGIKQIKRAVYTSEGGWAFLFADEYLIMVGGNKEGKAQVSFIGSVEFPEGITTVGIDIGEEVK